MSAKSDYGQYCNCNILTWKYKKGGCHSMHLPAKTEPDLHRIYPKNNNNNNNKQTLNTKFLSNSKADIALAVTSIVQLYFEIQRSASSHSSEYLTLVCPGLHCPLRFLLKTLWNYEWLLPSEAPCAFEGTALHLLALLCCDVSQRSRVKLGLKDKHKSSVKLVSFFSHRKISSLVVRGRFPLNAPSVMVCLCFWFCIYWMSDTFSQKISWLENWTKLN